MTIPLGDLPFKDDAGVVHHATAVRSNQSEYEMACGKRIATDPKYFLRGGDVTCILCLREMMRTQAEKHERWIAGQ